MALIRGNGGLYACYAYYYCYEHAISSRVISDDVGCVIAVGGRGAWLLSFSAWRGQ